MDDLGQVGPASSSLVGLEQPRAHSGPPDLAQVRTSSIGVTKVSPRRRLEKGLRSHRSLPDERAGHRPRSVRRLLQPDVLDDRVDELATDLDLDMTLDGSANTRVSLARCSERRVDQAGRQDLTTLDADDPGHRDKDPLARAHLDDQTDDPGPGPLEC